MPIKKGYRESSRDLMRKFYEKNNYPTLEERRLIAEQSGLNIGNNFSLKTTFILDGYKNSVFGIGKVDFFIFKGSSDL